jgi:cell division protein FtsI (penicillin-binding protein 3)
VVLVLWLILALAIGWRLVSLQVRSGDELRELAAAQSERDIELPARRGRIYDRDLGSLATSVTATSVYAHPRRVAEAGPEAVRQTAAALAPVLGRTPADIEESLRADVSFIYLGRQLDPGVAEEVAQLRLPGGDQPLPGVGVLREPRREYPTGELASQVVGFAGVDNVGLSGLERRFDDLLSGTPGRVRLEVGNNGLTIGAAPEEISPALAGTDVVLTIDRQIQNRVERTLAETVSEFNAEAGSAVVLDVRTGDVLAMASMPMRRGGAQTARLRAVTDVFEPGSVGKVVTAAAALEEGLVTPGTTFTVPDSYRVAGRTYSDSHGHATEAMTVKEIIADSSNVGTIMLAERLGEERLDDYIRRFGFGERTGVGFPGEGSGFIPAVEDWSSSSLPTLAIGQGMSATALQIADAYATIAAGGVGTEPRLVHGTVGGDGRLREAAAAPRHQVVSEKTADQVKAMLAQVVADGTGANASVEGYRVAGKTGTAQKAYENRRGYEPGAFYASFAGFAPVDDPRLAVVVSLDEPRPAYYGGTVSAPASDPRSTPPTRSARREPRRCPAGRGGSVESAARPPILAADAIRRRHVCHLCRVCQVCHILPIVNAAHAAHVSPLASVGSTAARSPGRHARRCRRAGRWRAARIGGGRRGCHR